MGNRKVRAVHRVAIYATDADPAAATVVVAAAAVAATAAAATAAIAKRPWCWCRRGLRRKPA